MGKFGSGILDGKSVSKTPKLKGIDLLGSNDTSEDEKLRNFFQLFLPAVNLNYSFNLFFTLPFLANSTFQYISYKS